MADHQLKNEAIEQMETKNTPTPYPTKNGITKV